MSTRKNVFYAMIIGLIGMFMFGCGSEEDLTVGKITQALDADHTRVIRECSQAISGSWWTYDETNWPEYEQSNGYTGVTLGSYAYISNDLGAWGKLLDATTAYSVRGYYTSCRSEAADPPSTDPDEGVVNYTPCHLAYGDLDTASSYDYQGGYYHGGQCKPFMNLVAYRSGLYQNPYYAWKSFPTDLCIYYTTATCNYDPAYRVARPTDDTDMPMATYSNIEPGDYLRLPWGHALIVVRKIDSSNVVVLDSNWVGGGNGYEKIGSHVLGFSGSGNNNLGNYRVLKCAYTGNC